MLKRIYLKGLSIIDLLLGKIHLYLEKKEWIARLSHSVETKAENAVRVSHVYPINFTEKDKHLFDHYINYDTQPETIFRFGKVNVSERGIVFKKFNNIGLSFPHVVFRAEFGWLYILKQYMFKKRSRPGNKTYILLYDFWSAGNYYHWLVDSMPRLLICQDLLKRDDHSLLLPADCPRFIKQTLSYFDIRHLTFIAKDEFLSVEKLLLPYYLAGSGHIHPLKVPEVIRVFKEKINAPFAGKDRIYVSRGRQKARKVKNEAEVIEVVKQSGFTIIYFEDFTFEEQVSLAKHTKVMVSSHGANLTNLMFMPENSRVFELIRDDRPNFCYWALASVSKVDYYYQLCSVVGNDHLQVDVELFKFNLQKILNG